MNDQIHTMRTFFASTGHDPVTPRRFAPTTLAGKQREVLRQLAAVGFVAITAAALLEVKLGDPDKPVASSLRAIVSGGSWIVKCECGGAEFADFQDPIFMCCACWNIAAGFAWRSVALPRPIVRGAIESVLLARPVEKTRSWFADETLEQLLMENRDHKLVAGIDAATVAIASAQMVAEVVVDA